MFRLLLSTFDCNNSLLNIYRIANATMGKTSLLHSSIQQSAFNNAGLSLAFTSKQTLQSRDNKEPKHQVDFW